MVGSRFEPNEVIARWPGAAFPALTVVIEPVLGIDLLAEKAAIRTAFGTGFHLIIFRLYLASAMNACRIAVFLPATRRLSVSHALSIPTEFIKNCLDPGEPGRTYFVS